MIGKGSLDGRQTMSWDERSGDRHISGKHYVLADTESGRYKQRVDLNAECRGLKDGTGSGVGGGLLWWCWQWWQTAITGKHDEIRFFKVLQQSPAHSPRVKHHLFTRRHTNTHTHATHTRANTKAAHAETDGASDFNRSSKSYSPVTMVVAAVDGVIIALPWALL